MKDKKKILEISSFTQFLGRFRNLRNLWREHRRAPLFPRLRWKIWSIIFTLNSVNSRNGQSISTNYVYGANGRFGPMHWRIYRRCTGVYWIIRNLGHVHWQYRKFVGGALVIDRDRSIFESYRQLSRAGVPTLWNNSANVARKQLKRKIIHHVVNRAGPQRVVSIKAKFPRWPLAWLLCGTFIARQGIKSVLYLIGIDV